MQLSRRRILVTGANGFIGKNLVVRVKEFAEVDVRTFGRGDDVARLPDLIAQVDAVVHLAGENRPADESFFAKTNIGLTAELCNVIRTEFRATGRDIPLIFSSSVHARFDNPYGRSKLAAESELQALSQETGNPCVIFRLPGVFGKWCKPNYNSVVATFCHNIARGLPIAISDPTRIVRLVYIDDVVNAFLDRIDKPVSGFAQAIVEPEFSVSLGELERQIRRFAESRDALFTERVGVGFVRALYATYLSYVPTEHFSYLVPKHADTRGKFVELLKTHDSGQFSCFTAYPGVTRGGHYHHSKAEKFLVIKGEALFRFRHVVTGDYLEIRASGECPRVVETIPGWSHDITNVGQDEMVVMLWANEKFDREKPDTIFSKI